MAPKKKKLKRRYEGDVAVLTQVLRRHIGRPNFIEYPDHEASPMVKSEIIRLAPMIRDLLQIQDNLSFKARTMTLALQQLTDLEEDCVHRWFRGRRMIARHGLG